MGKLLIVASYCIELMVPGASYHNLRERLLSISSLPRLYTEQLNRHSSAFPSIWLRYATVNTAFIVRLYSCCYNLQLCFLCIDNQLIFYSLVVFFTDIFIIDLLESGIRICLIYLFVIMKYICYCVACR